MGIQYSYLYCMVIPIALTVFLPNCDWKSTVSINHFHLILKLHFLSVLFSTKLTYRDPSQLYSILIFVTVPPLSDQTGLSPLAKFKLLLIISATSSLLYLKVFNFTHPTSVNFTPPIHKFSFFANSPLRDIHL